MTRATIPAKAYTDPGPVRAIPDADTLNLPLAGRFACVADGAWVDADETVALPTRPDALPLHAPLAGAVHLAGDLLVLTPTGAESSPPAPARPADTIEFLALLRDMGVAGLGGAGFPTHLKLRPGLDMLIVNAVECEPGVSADQAVLESRTDELIAALDRLVDLIGPAEAVIAVDGHNVRAKDLLASRAGAFRLADAPAAYPAGSERQLVAALTGNPLAPGERPAARRIALINLSTLAAIADAFDGRPMSHRVVTVHGDACSDPGNFRIAFGTPIAHIANVLGGDDVTAIRTGGSLTGSLAAPGAVVGPGTLAVELLRHTPAREAVPCIRCGVCAPVCPEQLNPQRLLESLPSPNGDTTDSRNPGLDACLLCGACTAVCPSAIPLNDLFRAGRAALRAERAANAAADRARERFERHAARDRARAARRAERLRSRRQKADAKALIAAAKGRRT